MSSPLFVSTLITEILVCFSIYILVLLHIVDDSQSCIQGLTTVFRILPRLSFSKVLETLVLVMFPALFTFTLKQKKFSFLLEYLIFVKRQKLKTIWKVLTMYTNFDLKVHLLSHQLLHLPWKYGFFFSLSPHSAELKRIFSLLFGTVKNRQKLCPPLRCKTIIKCSLHVSQRKILK